MKSRTRLRVWGHQRRAFTLLEVMISLGLLTYIVMTVSNAQAGAIFFSNYTQNLIFATNLARSKMTDLELETQRKSMKELKNFSDKGKFKDYPEFSFRMMIKSTKIKIPVPKAVMESNPMMKQLMTYMEKDIFFEGLVEISWEGDDKKKSITVRRLFANWDFISTLEKKAGSF